MKGQVVLLDERGKQIEGALFNYSDEIVTAMRKLLADHNMRIGFHK